MLYPFGEYYVRCYYLISILWIFFLFYKIQNSNFLFVLSLSFPYCCLMFLYCCVMFHYCLLIAPYVPYAPGAYVPCSLLFLMFPYCCVMFPYCCLIVTFPYCFLQNSNFLLVLLKIFGNFLLHWGLFGNWLLGNWVITHWLVIGFCLVIVACQYW